MKNTVGVAKRWGRKAPRERQTAVRKKWKGEPPGLYKTSVRKKYTKNFGDSNKICTFAAANSEGELAE